MLTWVLLVELTAVLGTFPAEVSLPLAKFPIPMAVSIRVSSASLLLLLQMEMTSTELSKRDSEVYALQSRLEMSQKQQQDQTHHINVLKEQVKTREHKIAMLTADVSERTAEIAETSNEADSFVCYLKLRVAPT